MGPPCDAWGGAADRGCHGPIRSKYEPWGLPESQLTARQCERLGRGNTIFRCALRLMRALCRYRVPTIVEHPINSRIWHTPELLTLARQHGGHTRVFDQCQFGRCWRKRTKLMFFHIDPADTVKFGRTCKGSHGICSRTARAHFVLEGAAPNGRKWTAIAASYPSALCKSMVQTLLANERDVIASSFG